MHTFTVPAVLSIAGSDSSGGAGIQADIKTIAAHGLFAETAITALTAQNTTGVRDVLEATPEFVGEQIDAVFEDIPPAAVKIGMVSSAAIIETIAQRLERWGAVDIVVDPVMVATSGAKLLADDAIETLCTELLPLAAVATPNLAEAEILSGQSIESEADMRSAAETIGRRYHCAVLCKGGHKVGGADDLLWTPQGIRWYRGERIDNPNTHGTGCTLSSAIAANLAKGLALEEAIGQAKEYLTGALKAMLDLGHGSGPLDHGYQLQKLTRI